MNLKLNKATLDYVRQHADEDVRMLALRGTKDPDVDLTLALQQIQGRQTARQKLPSWAAKDAILYPPHLNMEQCSSEATARYKLAVARRLLASLHSQPASSASPPNLTSLPSQPSSPASPPNLTSLPSHAATSSQPNLTSLPSQPSSPASPPNLTCLPSYAATSSQPSTPSSAPHSTTLLDLTGGLGVDFAFMQQAFDAATYVELSPSLFAIATQNFATLGLQVSTHNTDAATILHATTHVTLAFLDPARRDDHGARTYAISDCTPDILTLKDELLHKADFVLLKLSPILDWRKAVSDLGPQTVREVHIVSVNNECKELLILLQSSPTTSPTLHCVNLPDDLEFKTPLFNNTIAKNGADIKPSFPLDGPEETFLYEPNASIMKAGCFDALAAHYAIAPLSHDSHLFISPRPIDDFPGRHFLIIATTSLNKRDLKTALRGITHANITTRNFPLSAPALRQRLKLADGGDTYIFATTLADGAHILLICKKSRKPSICDC